MIVIRPEQSFRLGAYERGQFVLAVFQMLVERFPEESADMGADTLMTLIDRGIALALTFGFTLEPDVARFLELMIGLGEDFTVNPDYRWTWEMLRCTDHTPEKRLDAIIEQLAFGGR